MPPKNASVQPSLVSTDSSAPSNTSLPATTPFLDFMRGVGTSAPPRATTAASAALPPQSTEASTLPHLELLQQAARTPALSTAQKPTQQTIIGDDSSDDDNYYVPQPRATLANEQPKPTATLAPAPPIPTPAGAAVSSNTRGPARTSPGKTFSAPSTHAQPARKHTSRPSHTTSTNPVSLPAQAAASVKTPRLSDADRKRNYDFLKQVLGELAVVLGDDLGRAATIRDPARFKFALEQLLNDGPFDHYLDFNRPYFEASLRDKLSDALDYLLHDKKYFEAINQLADEINTARVGVLRRLDTEKHIDVLMAVGSKFIDRALTTALRTPTYDPRQLNVLTEKMIIPHVTGAKRLTTVEYIRGYAESKLDDLFATNRQANEQALIPLARSTSPVASVEFNAAHVETMLEKDEILLTSMKATRSPVKGGFFAGASFEKRAKDFLDMSFTWLGAEFQASARYYSTQQRAYFQALARDAAALVSTLYQQKLQISERLNSIPRDQQFDSVIGIDDVKAHTLTYHKRLSEELYDIEKQLEKPMEVLDKLRGTGVKEDGTLICNGVLETCQEIHREPIALKAILPNIEVYCTDKPESELANITGSNPHTVIDAPSGTELREHAHTPWKVREGLNPGKVRVYELHQTIAPTATTPASTTVYGRFLEEHGSTKTDGNKITVLMFPTPKAAQLTPPEEAQLHEERVKFAMAMAAQMIAGLKHAPSKENPVVITGRNAEELKYLTSAVLAMGEMAQPTFGKEAIKLRSVAPEFSNQNWQTVLFGGWFSGGFFHDFKKSTYVENNRDFVEKLMKEKFVLKKSLQTAQESGHEIRNVSVEVNQTHQAEETQHPPERPMCRMP